MKLTDPGLGSGTFPVYSLHFESCTSMYGPSKAFCTSEKAYWQIADALIFFLKDNTPPPPRRHNQRTHSGLMIQCWINTEELLSGEQLPPRSNFKHITDHKRQMTGEKVTRLLGAVLYSLKTVGVKMVKFCFLRSHFPLESYQFVLNGHVGVASLTGVLFSLYLQ